MKKFYYILPVVLMVGFSAYFLKFDSDFTAAQEAAKQKAAEVKAAEELRKKEEAKRSREDSEKRTAQRMAEEKAREEERVAKYVAETKRIQDEANGYATEAAALAAEIKDLEGKLSAIKASKDSKNRELLAASREVETAAMEKYRTEMEIQRMNELLVRKAAGTSLVKLAKQ